MIHLAEVFNIKITINNFLRKMTNSEWNALSIV